MMKRSVGKIPEDLGLLHELHERRRVGIQVVRTRRMKGRIARRTDVDHCRHIKFNEFLIQRVPATIR